MIGLGNPLLGHDAFGPRVIEHLRREAPEAARGADLLDVHTDLMSQIDRLPAYERVVLVDAILVPEERASEAGRILVPEEPSLQAYSDASPTVHQMSPILALKLFRCIHPHAATRIHLVGLVTSQASASSGTVANLAVPSSEAIAAGAANVLDLV